MPDQDKTAISIILVSYNSSDTIERSVRSLLDNAPRCRHQIVLVDNASDDGSAELVATKFPQVSVIKNPHNVGFGVANNIGMKLFPAEFYYLHNIDAYLNASVLDVAMEHARREGYGIVGFPLVYPDGTPQTSAYSFTSPSKWLLQDLKVDVLAKRLARSPVLGGFIWRLAKRFRVSRTLAATESQALYGNDKISLEPVDWVCGASLLLSQEAHRVTGGFDEEIFLYGEDEDLCRTAKVRGVKVGQIRGLVPVTHDFGWGKAKKSSANIVRLKRESMLYCIDKWFRRSSLSKAIMQIIINRRYKV